MRPVLEERCLRVLRYLAAEGGHRDLPTIAAATGIPVHGLGRLAATLVRRGWAVPRRDGSVGLARAYAATPAGGARVGYVA